MAMSRDDMLRFAISDLKALRSEKCSYLLSGMNGRIRGYAGAMWHAGIIVEREWRALLDLADNAERYAKRECKY